MAEVQPADPAARKKAVLLLVVATLCGVVLIALFEDQRHVLRTWIVQDPSPDFRRLSAAFTYLALAISLPLLGFAAYIWRLGARVLRVGRFPPPGTALVRDTRIRTGRDAHRYARLIQCLAMGLVLMAVAVAVVFWRIGRLVTA